MSNYYLDHEQCKTCGAPAHSKLTSCEYCGTEYHFLPRYYGELVAWDDIGMTLYNMGAVSKKNLMGKIHSMYDPVTFRLKDQP